jgi:hypothetical protein
MIVSGNWWMFVIVVVLICFIIYGMTSKIMQLMFSPKPEELKRVRVYPWQTFTQYIFLGIAIYLCFSQPLFLKQLISGILTELK